MGRARILVDAAVNNKYNRVESGAGLVRAKRLAKLTGAQINVVSGAEAFTPEEREEFRVLTEEQVESGDFEVAVLEWPDRLGKTKLRRS